MIKLPLSEILPDKPRLKEFGPFRVKGQGDLSNYNALQLRGGTGTGTIYIIGDLDFVTTAGVSLGKNLPITNSAAQTFYFKATSLSGGSIYITNQSKGGNWGEYNNNIWSNSGLIIGIGGAGMPNAPVILLNSKLLMPSTVTIDLFYNMLCEWEGTFADMPSSVKNLRINPARNDWTPYFPTDIDNFINKGGETLVLQRSGATTYIVLNINSTSTKLKDLAFRGFELRGEISPTRFPNLEYLYLETNSSPTLGNLVFNPNGFTKIKKLELKVGGSYNVGYVSPLSIRNLPTTLKYAIIQLNPTQTMISDFTDVSDISVNIEYFYLTNTVSAITYTPRTWGNTMDTIYLPNVSISTSSALDNLLIDLNRDVTTWTGTKLLRFKGTRSSASDAAVASLVAKGVTVTISA